MLEAVGMEPDYRISDREREDAVAQLRVHTQEGRLTLDELSGRVTEVYKAKTAFDLQFALRELPAASPYAPAVQPMAEAPAPRADDRASAQRRHDHAPHHQKKKGQSFRGDLAGFITPNLICILIWLVTMPGGYFWPIWVLIPTGVGFFARVVKGYDEPPRRSLNE